MVRYDINLSVIFHAESEGEAMKRLHKLLKQAGLEFCPDELKDGTYAIIGADSIMTPKEEDTHA